MTHINSVHDPLDDALDLLQLLRPAGGLLLALALLRLVEVLEVDVRPQAFILEQSLAFTLSG